MLKKCIINDIWQKEAFDKNVGVHFCCGEGGAVLTSDEQVFERIRCMIDPCGFYWEGRDEKFKPFVCNGARASEFEGAILNAQLDRLPDLIGKLRRHKARIVDATASSSLSFSPRHSPDGECATCVNYLLPSVEVAEVFAEAAGGTILAKTGRHNYTEWDPILAGQGAHHPALNPYDLPQNAECRKTYSKDMCSRSMEILGRTVSIGLRHNLTDDEIEALINRINAAV